MIRPLLICVALSLFTVPPAARAAEAKPNVIVILIDDTGWGEIGFQGIARDVPTPHMDSIAANGVKFTNGYVSGTYCSPTRAGLLTGKYQTRFGHEFNPAGPPAAHRGLPLSEKTMADRMKALGYATACVGKWHLGSVPEMLPPKRGFEEFYGTVANTPFFKPPNFVDTRVSEEVKPVTDENFYTTDAYGERAADWISKQKDKPYFLYLPFNAQHAPLQATKKYLDRFEGKIEDQNRKTFAAMMSAMDDAIGRVLEQVRKDGEEENTLIFFLSDNGGPTKQTTSQNGPLRGFKASTNEGGVRVPFAVQWKGRIPAGKVYEKPVIQLDILPTSIVAAGGTVESHWKLDGVDLMPFLTGKNQDATPHETLYWRFGKQWAIRKGDWKLVASNIDKLQPRLINLKDDIAEAKDLSAEHPEKVKELQAAYDAWNAEQAEPLWPQPPPAKQRQRQRQKQKEQQAT